MSGLTGPRLTGDKQSNGEKSFKQKGSTVLYPGASCCLNGGYLAPVTHTTGLKIVGAYMREESSDNAGADGAVTATVSLSRGTEGARYFKFDNDPGGGALAQADVGTVVYWLDDHTCTKTSTGASSGGTFVELDADGGIWIDFG